MNESNEPFQETEVLLNNTDESQESKKKIDLSLVAILGLTLVFLFLGFYKILFTDPSSQVPGTADTNVPKHELISSAEVQTLRLQLESDDTAENIVTSDVVSEDTDSDGYSVPQNILEPNVVGNEDTMAVEPILVETEAEVNIDPESHITFGKVYEDESYTAMSHPANFKGVVFSVSPEVGEFIIINNEIPTTVHVTSDTEFKIYESYFSISDLKSTDIVAITGKANIQGSDITADIVTLVGVQKIFITND